MKHKKPSKFCTWKEDDDGNYETACDDKFTFIDGTPKNNNFKFCPKCGKYINLKEIK